MLYVESEAEVVKSGDCFYCQNGLSSRCTECLVLGTDQLPGAQAQFVRVPFADTTVVKAPVGLRPTSLVLMADIFPTGVRWLYFSKNPILLHLTLTPASKSPKYQLHIFINLSPHYSTLPHQALSLMSSPRRVKPSRLSL
jgi:hypothetical protein